MIKLNEEQKRTLIAFGRKLDSELAKKRKPKKEFAQELGVTNQTLTNWLLHYNQPRLEHAQKIIDYFGNVFTFDDMGYEKDEKSYKIQN